MKLYRLTLSKPLRSTTQAREVHNLVMSAVHSRGVRVLFRIETPRQITVLAGDGAFEPRTLGAKLSRVEVKPYAPETRLGTQYQYRVRLNIAKRYSGKTSGVLETQEEVEELRCCSLRWKS